MRVSVIVPTYKRVGDLERCLMGLENQDRKPDEVIVVFRDTDLETQNFLKEFKGTVRIKKEVVDKTGQVAALNKGVSSANGNLICILDDDAVPRNSWLRNIESIFIKNPAVGGVGGRDFVHLNEGIIQGSKEIVGKLKWYGKVIGNHHLGVGEQREVDVLKGANMSYRREVFEKIQFDERLLGTGAQVGNDLAISLATKRIGWKLIYNSKVIVDHYPAQRFDEDKRNTFNEEALFNNTYNNTFIILEHFNNWFKRFVFLSWGIAIGTSDRPGFLQCIRHFLKGEKQNLLKLKIVVKARVLAYLNWKNQIG
ncbi:glycosyltransferase family 2 protein [Bacillus sp. 165]|uniref:glycosyltransferase family 2 protein n=1 Tax=Bacillus sp. 165 TaxID=1529117 RepID=UPI001AD9ECAB|nr:glycosyltransferase family 2 protein [Bacillus sp. 165]MBO9130029.1 glycosyltransferase family 2 protein [Bacillus sp. 165]